jgi:hypothetical protein
VICKLAVELSRPLPLFFAKSRHRPNGALVSPQGDLQTAMPVVPVRCQRRRSAAALIARAPRALGKLRTELSAARLWAALNGAAVVSGRRSARSGIAQRLTASARAGELHAVPPLPLNAAPAAPVSPA